MFRIIGREIKRLTSNRVYLFCLILMPLVSAVFFISVLDEGIPEQLPIAIVDNDNSSTTRALARRLDSFQTVEIVAHYNTVAEARQAIQQNKIYGFLYFPKGTTDNLLASRQPRISFYYSSVYISAGALVFRDMKTISTLGSAAVGQATMLAKGFTEKQAQTFLQPIVVDLHMLGNPWINYNYYISIVFVPACFLLFVLLLTPYSLGSELKMGTGKELMEMANGNIFKAVIGKLLPQTVVFFLMLGAFLFYVYYIMGFPHKGSFALMLLLTLASILASQGFAAFIFGIIPQMRLAMSVCSLWSVLSFSICGLAFPVFAMDGPLQSIAWLFPVRHFFIIYQRCILFDANVSNVWWNWAILIIFISLPLLVMGRLRDVFNKWDYIE